MATEIRQEGRLTYTARLSIVKSLRCGHTRHDFAQRLPPIKREGRRKQRPYGDEQSRHCPSSSFTSPTPLRLRVLPHGWMLICPANITQEERCGSRSLGGQIEGAPLDSGLFYRSHWGKSLFVILPLPQDASILPHAIGRSMLDDVRNIVDDGYIYATNNAGHLARDRYHTSVGADITITDARKLGIIYLLRHYCPTSDSGAGRASYNATPIRR